MTKFPAPRVSAIVLNFNGEKVIRACLTSLLNQTYKNMEIIVVDNASTDGSLDIVRREFQGIRLIVNKTNLGFGGGNNVGIAAAKGEFILILNNDTRLEEACVEELVSSIKKDKRYGACASRILLEKEKDLLDVAGIAVCLDGLSIGRGRLEHKDTFNAEEEVFFASDCACLYRKEMLDDIKLFHEVYDEDFFAYADETDLGWRARLAGWKCIYNPRATVYHCHSAAAGAYSSFKAFLVERNRIWVAIKNFPLPIVLSGLLFTFQRYCFQTYGVLANKGAAARFTDSAPRLELAKILIKANISAIRGMPKMLKKRRKILKNKRISNAEISVIFKKFGMSAKAISLKE